MKKTNMREIFLETLGIIGIILALIGIFILLVKVFNL